MTKNIVNETERMVVTRVFDAPRELVWKRDRPEIHYAWWDRRALLRPLRDGFRVGGIPLLHEVAGWQEFWNAVEYHEIVP